MSKFILNDETKVNQYGFRVLNSGLDIDRFYANPVMLDSHIGSNWAVIGKWKNIQIEGHLLTAEPDFDTEDPDSKKIAGKVERGYLNGASLGLNPFSMDNFQRAPDGVYDLVKCEILEASIVAIPNNANAIRLYASTEENRKEFTDNEVKEILLMASEISNFNYNPMKKITLTLGAISALELPGNTLEHDAELVDQKIIKLKSDLDAANLKIKGFEELEKDKKAKLSADAVELDIKAGKIDATKKADFIKLHAENPDLYKSIISAVPAKNNLSVTVAAVTVGEIKNLDDFQKLDLTAQLQFKESNPEGYKALFNA